MAPGGGCVVRRLAAAAPVSGELVLHAGARALGRGEARALTDEVKADAETLWRKLHRLYGIGWSGVTAVRSGRDAARLRFALTPDAAAEALSMSRDSFDRYVRDELRIVRRGRLVLIPVVEIERWLDREAARTLERDRG